jgi:predicted MFS family arabinose efflux permease
VAAEEKIMVRKIIYWIATGLIAALGAFAGFTYLKASPQAVEGFTHIGYPQQLRVILGIAKLLGGIALVIPGLPILKEWAYAGFTFAWICAFVAHYLAKDGQEAYMPLVLLLILAVSYFTRPPSHRWQARLNRP